MKHNLGVAYSMKKKSAPHMCHGGDCAHPSHGKAAHMSEGGMMGEAAELAPLLMAAAHGGEVEEEPMHPMIKKILMGRMKGYSKGGMVSNEESGESSDEPTMAKADGNEFDDLALDDDLEMSETGANSGDDLGDEAEDHDREDVISRVMKSRAKKDRNPRPA